MVRKESSIMTNPNRNNNKNDNKTLSQKVAAGALSFLLVTGSVLMTGCDDKTAVATPGNTIPGATQPVGEPNHNQGQDPVTSPNQDPNQGSSGNTQTSNPNLNGYSGLMQQTSSDLCASGMYSMRDDGSFTVSYTDGSWAIWSPVVKDGKPYFDSTKNDFIFEIIEYHPPKKIH